MVCAPLESADLLSMSLETALRLEGRGSDVTLQDHAITTPRRQLVRIPRQRTWQSEMGSKGDLQTLKQPFVNNPSGKWMTVGIFYSWNCARPHRARLSTHPLWLCVLLVQRASSLLLHPRSVHSLYEYPLPPGYPEKTWHTLNITVMCEESWPQTAGCFILF